MKHTAAVQRRHQTSFVLHEIYANRVDSMEEDGAVAIESRSGLGNVLVAKKAFKAGMIVALWSVSRVMRD
jgi:hypothetical protein